MTKGPLELVDTVHGLKIDLFVLGDGLLDRMQIERRMHVTIPGVSCIALRGGLDRWIRLRERPWCDAKDAQRESLVRARRRGHRFSEHQRVQDGVPVVVPL